MLATNRRIGMKQFTAGRGSSEASPFSVHASWPYPVARLRGSPSGVPWAVSSSAVRSDRKINRYSIACRDFEKAVSYAAEAGRLARDTVAHEGLLLAAIVSYYRPFTANERDANARASRSLRVEDMRLSTEQAELHQLLGTLRNKALAHAEWAYSPSSVTDEGIFQARPFDLLAHISGVAPLLALAQHALNVCHDVRANHARQLREGGSS